MDGTHRPDLVLTRLCAVCRHELFFLNLQILHPPLSFLKSCYLLLLRLVFETSFSLLFYLCQPVTSLSPAPSGNKRVSLNRAHAQHNKTADHLYHGHESCFHFRK